MKKALVFIALVGAIVLVWVSIAKVVRIEDGRMAEEAIKTARYSSDKPELAFDYPSHYVLDQEDLSTGQRERYSVTLIEKSAAEDMERTEGPTAITIDMYQNDLDMYTAEGFATSTADSNWKLGNGDLAPALVDGKEGVSYTWSGLYEGRSVVIARPDYVYVFSVTWMTSEDQILKDFDAILSNATFVSDSVGAWKPYANSSFGFSAEVPPDFAVNESYFNYTLGPGKEIPGISFVIPESMATGTNLSADTRMSVEVLSRAACTPSDFIVTKSKGTPVTIGGNSYVYAISSGAGAGNRYEESIYVTKQRELCYGIRFFIHSTAIGNYSEGTRKEFDKMALVSTFKKIMETVRFI